MYEYEDLNRLAYDCGENGHAIYLPVCPTCRRFVKADDSISTNDEGIVSKTNATCSKCGRVDMPFEGFFSARELGMDDIGGWDERHGNQKSSRRSQAMAE